LYLRLASNIVHQKQRNNGLPAKKMRASRQKNAGSPPKKCGVTATFSWKKKIRRRKTTTRRSLAIIDGKGCLLIGCTKPGN
jgi:hypothetical protein